ncbi:TetR/AcrR family transcriptional regulator [Novosphingobium flavum]|uniref:TetR/AcrR family transcriptional regulator n=1 Tax=Novosphingobium flavum TaxID=1778672 RepID=A0A7X1FSL6_9SPHN|nr:TetR/AcrR family transcriptional regulator [Novosphingobium flavum]MBC2665702.1 TetR/AcrR family transcriptional regulator [Novosphingobium flavum]
MKNVAADGRLARRKVQTRAALLEAAYVEMSSSGIDSVKIRDITDRADVGFGTFYNYFESRDALAGQVLDCVIHDMGRRNIKVTAGLREREPALVIPTSMRLFIHEAVSSTMWQWWAKRPDLLCDRMRDGFGPFGRRDMRDGIRIGVLALDPANIETCWGQANWMLVGAIHDIYEGKLVAEESCLIVESIMRMMGVERELAHHVSSTPLPNYPAANVDWTFDLAAFRAGSSGA